MDLIVVPLLLAAHVPPNTHAPPIYLESTFYGDVHSMLTIEEGYIVKFFLINFTSKLICIATASNKLGCYIKNPKLKVTSMIMSTVEPNAEILRETTDTIPFDYTHSTPIELVFSPSGIVDYNIPIEVHPSTYFLDLFQTITSEMNIGKFDMGEKESTGGWQTTHIGTCPTNYTVAKSPNLRMYKKYRFKLKSISNFELEDNKMLIIKKQQSPDTCNPFTDYMFGINHINTSSLVHYKMKESTTHMQISTQEFSSVTNSSYKIYNQDEKEIGNATQHVYLQLDTI